MDKINIKLTNTEPIKLNELAMMEQNLMINLNYLLANKYRFSPQYYNQLLNYHNMSLSVLNNLKFNTNIPKLISDTTPKEYDIYSNQSWEAQFDKKVENPPMYSLPSSNVWSLKYTK